MNEFVINDLSGLLSGYLGNKKEITDAKLSRLTNPGENYGSLMLRLQLKWKSLESGEEGDLDAVAKLLNENEAIRKAFDNETSCRSETAVYTTIVPTLKRFQRSLGIENTIDWSAEVYGARINLNGTDIVDDNACMILENLRTKGFSNVPRRQGFDFETAKLVLESLASFHAVPLALKLNDSKTFEEMIKPYCVGIEPPSEIYEKFVTQVLHQHEKFRDKFPHITVWRRKPPAREPFATMVHGDLWINNTMQKFENGKASRNKIIDFQSLDYGSPTSDVLMFILSSVNKKVLERHLDDLLTYYHQNFITILEVLRCDTGPFSYEAFLEELRKEGRFEFGHVMIFALVIRESEEGKNQTNRDSVENMMSRLTQDALDHAYFVADVCFQRGWY